MIHPLFPVQHRCDLRFPAAELLAQIFDLHIECGAFLIVQLTGVLRQGTEFIIHHPLLLCGGGQRGDFLAEFFFLRTHLFQTLAGLGLLMIDGVTACGRGRKLLGDVGKSGVELRTTLGGLFHLAAQNSQMLLCGSHVGLPGCQRLQRGLQVMRQLKFLRCGIECAACFHQLLLLAGQGGARGGQVLLRGLHRRLKFRQLGHGRRDASLLLCQFLAGCHDRCGSGLVLLLGLAGGCSGGFSLLFAPRDPGFDFTQDHLLVLLPHEQIFHFMAQGHPAFFGLLAVMHHLLQSRGGGVDLRMAGFQTDASLFMLLAETLQRDLGADPLLAHGFELAGLLSSLGLQLLGLLLQHVNVITKNGFLLLTLLQGLVQRRQPFFGVLAAILSGFQTLFGGGKLGTAGLQNVFGGLPGVDQDGDLFFQGAVPLTQCCQRGFGAADLILRLLAFDV